MSAKRHEESPGQESLIIAASAAGEMLVRDFTEEAPAVSLVEHHLQQLHVLSLFGAIHQKEWIVRNPEIIAGRYPKNHQKVIQTAKEQRRGYEAEAKTEFFRSIGYYAVEDSGVVCDIAPYLKDAKHQWQLFQARFRSVAKSDARLAETERLIMEIKTLTDNRTAYNREHGLRPHAPDKVAVRRDLQDAQPVVRGLTTRERLVAIAEDPRAGFLPTNNDEKNKVLAYLDYLDNPEYPLGINNQFIEVFIHQQKPKDKPNRLELARQAMTSLTYELGDHLINADTSLRQLQALDAEVSDCPNPYLRLTEPEGIGYDHPGLAALIRYRDLRNLRNNGILPAGIKDPLRVKEDRRPHDEPGKNKTLEDRYTGATVSEEMKNYLMDEAEKLTIGQVRRFIKEAIKDQQVRRDFLAARMRDFRLAPDARSLTMWPIAQGILERLGLPLEAA